MLCPLPHRVNRTSNCEFVDFTAMPHHPRHRAVTPAPICPTLYNAMKPSSRPYFLRSARLGFSTWTLPDLPLAISLWGNARITRFTGGPFSEAQVESRLHTEISSMREHGAQYWPLFLLTTGEFVGSAGLRVCKSHERIFAMGFYLLRDYWRQGLAEEASRAVISYSFEILGASRLYAGHHPQNAASRALLTKLGFKFSHEELYPPTGLNHPGYFLERP
jgi:RimJ/RimL family protein N-acetyltransferase